MMKFYKNGCKNASFNAYLLESGLITELSSYEKLLTFMNRAQLFAFLTAYLMRGASDNNKLLKQNDIL